MAAPGIELLERLHPAAQPYALAALEAFREATGIYPTVTSVYRSTAEQARLYAQRASNPYPVAKPGNSAHNYALAWDASVPAKYDALWRKIRTEIGWVVPSDDKVHAEVRDWRSLVQRYKVKAI